MGQNQLPRCRGYVVPRCGKWLVRLFVVAILFPFLIGSPAKAEPVPIPASPAAHPAVTFSHDIAPILFNNCVICHRPGQSAPFSLTNYSEVKKHAKEIGEVTQRRYMPPWLPEPGFGEFVGERRLDAKQIALIERWSEEGSPEGDPSDLPAPPKWNSDWLLGPPDLVLAMPRAFTTPAEGRDIYRNFVIPASLTNAHYVKGIEFQPGNPKIVHHAFIKVDRTQASRRLEAKESTPGFPGMDVPAEMPDGHLLGWQPGRLPALEPEGLAWRLDPGNDLIFQMHLNPDGKPETLQPKIGLYFTDAMPTNKCFKLELTSFAIDIPADETNYVVEDSYTLPIDSDALAVLPHAHYLAQEMRGWATLPDGTKKWLLFIKHWDFNWQGDYRYAEPVFLPKGTVLAMRFTYDNSTNNLQNPNRPPKAVEYGSQSKDEMAELWLQLLPRRPGDIPTLAADYQRKVTRLIINSDEFKLRKNPDDANAHVELGVILFFSMNRPREAERQFQAAIRADPNYAQAHYHYGTFLRYLQRLSDAESEFEAALRLDPNDAKSHGNLGLIMIDLGRIPEAESHLRDALRLDPEDTLAKETLEQLAKAKTSSPKQ